VTTTACEVEECRRQITHLVTCKTQDALLTFGPGHTTSLLCQGHATLASQTPLNPPIVFRKFERIA
jgi:hypothetical protein